MLAAGRPQLIFLLFVVGLSLAPGLVAHVPVVQRGDHDLEPAGKRDFFFFFFKEHWV